VRQEECFLIFFNAFLPLQWSFLTTWNKNYLLSINGTNVCQQKRAIVHLVTD